MDNCSRRRRKQQQESWRRNSKKDEEVGEVRRRKEEEEDAAASEGFSFSPPSLQTFLRSFSTSAVLEAPMAQALQDAFQKVGTPSTKLRISIFRDSVASLLDNPGRDALHHFGKRK